MYGLVCKTIFISVQENFSRVNVIFSFFMSLNLVFFNSHSPTMQSYMQKTCDVAEKAISAKKIAEKVRKSRQNVNPDTSA